MSTVICVLFLCVVQCIFRHVFPFCELSLFFARFVSFANPSFKHVFVTPPHTLSFSIVCVNAAIIICIWLLVISGHVVESDERK